MSEHIGKFGIKRGLLKDEFTIFRIEREAEQFLIGLLLDNYAGEKCPASAPVRQIGAFHEGRISGSS